MTYKIGWLFSDVLYLHGERGNILAIEKAAKVAGLETEIIKISLEDPSFDPMDFDFLFCPPGEISSFPAIIDYLKPYTDALKTYIDSGRPLLVTGTSVCLFGKTITREDQRVIKGLNILNVSAEEKNDVYGDDLYYETTYNHTKMNIFGNQIQMHDLKINDETPFGKVIYGYGNTGHSRNEGVLKNNAIFTHALGPVLVLNPWLTESLLKIMAENKNTPLEHFKLNTDLEAQSLESKLAFIKTKDTPLKTYFGTTD